MGYQIKQRKTWMIEIHEGSGIQKTQGLAL